MVDYIPEVPEVNVFTAKHANPEEAKSVADTFVFTATLNETDVTASTKFKINGTQIHGNTYVPHRVGTNSVIATMDEHEYTFKFTVLEKEEEPEPTGNRIDYDGNSYEVKKTFWILNLKPDKTPYGYNITLQDGSKVLCTRWIMASTSEANPATITQILDSDYCYLSFVYVPVKSDNSVAFPDETTTYLETGMVKINANEFVMEDVEYIFNSVTDTDADYEGESMLDNAKTAQLFWNGPYTFTTIDLGSKPKGKTSTHDSKMNFISKTQINNLKVTK